MSFRFDGYLFDCDGSVVKNAEDVHGASVYQTLQNIFSHAGLSFPTSYFQQTWTSQLGKGIENFFNVFVDGLQTSDRSLVAQFCENAGIFEGTYERHYIDLAHSGQAGLIVRKGMGSIVTRANDENAPFSIISNAKQAVLDATVAATRIDGDIALVAGKDTIEAVKDKDKKQVYYAKPHPGSYQYGLDKLELNPARCLGLEDNISGLTSLVRAGIGTIIFCHNDQSVPMPEYVAKHAHAIVGPDDCLEGTVARLLEDRGGRKQYPSRAVVVDAPRALPGGGGGLFAIPVLNRQ